MSVPSGTFPRAAVTLQMPPALTSRRVVHDLRPVKCEFSYWGDGRNFSPTNYVQRRSPKEEYDAFMGLSMDEMISIVGRNGVRVLYQHGLIKKPPIKCARPHYSAVDFTSFEWVAKKFTWNAVMGLIKAGIVQDVDLNYEWNVLNMEEVMTVRDNFPPKIASKILATWCGYAMGRYPLSTIDAHQRAFDKALEGIFHGDLYMLVSHFIYELDKYEHSVYGLERETIESLCILGRVEFLMARQIFLPFESLGFLFSRFSGVFPIMTKWMDEFLTRYKYANRDDFNIDGIREKAYDIAFLRGVRGLPINDAAGYYQNNRDPTPTREAFDRMFRAAAGPLDVHPHLKMLLLMAALLPRSKSKVGKLVENDGDHAVLVRVLGMLR